MVGLIIAMNVKYVIRESKKHIAIKLLSTSITLKKTAVALSVVILKRLMKVLATEHWSFITHKTTRSLPSATQYQKEWGWIELKKKLTSA